MEQVPPFACSFSKMTANSHLLAVVDEDGFVTLIDTSQAAKVVKGKNIGNSSNNNNGHLLDAMPCLSEREREMLRVSPSQ